VREELGLLMVREPDKPYRRVRGVEACTYRHFYAYYGWVGSSSPECRRCGAPNNTYDPSRDPFHDDPETAYWARRALGRNR
jgi:hypothetical protein